MISPDQQLTAGLSLTHKIHELAKKGEWDDLAPIFEERDRLLRASFEVEGGFTSRSTVEDVVRQILDVDRQTMELNGAERNRLKADLKLVSTGRQAVAAYNNVSSNGNEW